MLTEAAFLLLGCLFAACMVRAQHACQIQGIVRRCERGSYTGRPGALEAAQQATSSIQVKCAGAYVPALQTGDYNLTVSFRGIDTWQGMVLRLPTSRRGCGSGHRRRSLPGDCSRRYTPHPNDGSKPARPD